MHIDISALRLIEADKGVSIDTVISSVSACPPRMSGSSPRDRRAESIRQRMWKPRL